jgi:putative DNA primase/helicase
MGAREVAQALSPRARREGRSWRTLCPVHRGFSLLVADGRDGKLLVKCWGNSCAVEDIFEALRDRDLDDDSWSRDDDHRDHRTGDAQQHTLWARRAWERGKSARHSPVETYWHARGLGALAIPPTLRFAPSCKHTPTQSFLPAMLAKVVDCDGEFLALHRTYLRVDGLAKADVDPDCQKMSLGPTRGGVVRLAPHDPYRALILGEGIESVASLMIIRCLPGWAGVSTSVLKCLALPSAVRRVLIAVDHDRNGAGERAARVAGQRWVAEGREVRLAMPREFGDWNDVLLQGICRG